MVLYYYILYLSYILYYWYYYINKLGVVERNENVHYIIYAAFVGCSKYSKNIFQNPIDVCIQI